MESAFDNKTLVVAPTATACYVRWDEKGKRAESVLVMIDNTDGLISLPYVRNHAKYLEYLGMLVDEELVEWVAIGPEDSEPFATEKLNEMMKENS